MQRKLNVLWLLMLSIISTQAQNWNNVGPAGFSAGDVYYTSLAVDGNTPYVAYTDASLNNKGFVRQFNGSNWVVLGGVPFTADATAFLSLVVHSNTPYVAYRDDANGLKATVKKFDGVNWVNVGAPGFSVNQADYLCLAFEGNTPYVAFMDYDKGGKISVSKFNGSNWVIVGTAGFSTGIATHLSLAINGTTPYVAYRDQGNAGKAMVKKFDGTSWVNVGPSSASPNVASYITLAFNGSLPSISFRGVSTEGQYRKFDGSNWVVDGPSSFNISTAAFINMLFKGSTPFVAYSDGLYSGRAVVKQFDGTNWLNVGTPGFSIAAATYISFATAGNKLYIAYRDDGSVGKLTVKEFALPCLSSSYSFNETICQGNTYTFNGIAQSATGTYYDTLVNANGCDSLVTLNLTVNPSGSNTTTASSCGNYTWPVNNVTYTQSGTFTEVSVSNPCFTEILDLQITTPISNTTTIAACDSYTWAVNNQTYTQSGTYNAVNGCTTEILDLTVGQSTSSTTTINAAASYTWPCNNVTYTQSGTYICNGVNATNCPDIQTLILTLNPCNLSVTTSNASACPGYPIVLNGSPAGGTWSVANPYTGPSTAFTYFYTDPITGCNYSANALITVSNLAPVSITSVLVTSPVSATVNWNIIPGLLYYELRYRPVGSSFWTSGGTQAAPNAFKNLVGLTAGTSYEIEVRGICNLGNPGPWGSNTVFTTDPPCGTPSGLFTAPVSGTTAKLNWTSVSGATYYQLRYRLAGISAWTSAGTMSAPATAKTISGLTLNSNYEWQMRAVCNVATGPWSSIESFSTLANKEALDLESVTTNHEVLIFPNPLKDLMTVELTAAQSQTIEIHVFDMSGRFMKNIQANTEIGLNTFTINLSNLASGIYQVHVFADQKLLHISKLNKQD